MQGGAEVRLSFDPTGKPLSRARRLPAVIQLGER